MRTWTLPAALMTALAVAGCGDAPDDQVADESATRTADREPAAPPRAERSAGTAGFVGVDGADVTGTARVYEMRVAGAQAADTAGGGPASLGFRLEVAVEGLSAGDHDWHIHDGPCGESAGVVVAMTPVGDRAGIASPLTASGRDAPVRGAAMVRDLTVADLDDGRYSVRVHASSGEGGPGPVVACADLSGSAADHDAPR